MRVWSAIDIRARIIASLLAKYAKRSDMLIRR
jgi:hypothetical protein